jgi:hypothetical protein
MAMHNIILLCQRRRLICSEVKERHIQKLTSFHLGLLHRGILLGEFDENLMENIDETHFVVNCDNGRILGFSSDNVVKYADVVSGGQSMTLMVRISGGRRAIIEDPMMIFANADMSYPIRGLPEHVTDKIQRGG